MTPQAGAMIFSVLSDARADIERATQRIAEIGYLGVETYGLEGIPPARIRRALDNAGLQLTSAHVPFPAGPDFRRILDQSAELGARTLVWSMEKEEFGTPASVLLGLQRVNEASVNAAGYGMRIAYHNHFAEFSNRFDGRSAYELLLENLDPSVVVEFDMYWAQMGGADPAAVMRALGDRLELVHVKDGPAVSYEGDTMVPIGEGALDMPAALAAAARAGWLNVELERLAGDPWAALADGYRYMVDGGFCSGRKPAAIHEQEESR